MDVIINNGSKCDVCLEPVGKIKEFRTYQASNHNYEKHFVCEKCVNKLVERYFSLVNVL